MAFFYYLIALLAIVVLLYALLSINRYRSPLRTVPGDSSKLLFGTAENFMNNDFRFFEFFRQQRTKYGTIRKVPYPLGRTALYISDRQWAKYVLITNGANFANGEFLGSGFFKQAVGENGLVMVNGETHKRYKKILSPAYKLSTLKTSMPIIQLGGERMITLFSDYCCKNRITSGDFVGLAKIDMKHLFNKVTLDIALLFLLAYDLQESVSWKPETFGHYIWSVMDMQETLLTGLSVLYINSNFLRSLRNFCRLLPNGGNWQARTTNKMHDMIENIIQTQIELFHRKQNESSGNVKPFKPLLEYMLDTSTGVKLSREEIHDLIVTFIIGGHETASISLSFTLYELCKHPEYQVRLRNEVTNFLKENNDKIDWDDMKKLTFLNAVVKESLRMYPPVPWLPRITVNPDTIDGHYVPAKTMVTVITSELHRNPDIWPDPDDFKPERFLEPDDTIPWDAWLPFGDGLHKCIGYQFGLIEVTYLLAMIVKNFQFSFDPTVDYHEVVFASLNTKPAIKLYVSPL